MKKLVSPVTMFLFGVIAFAAIMLITRKIDLSFDSANFWFYRVLTALASASISISIPGMISINHVQQKDASGNLQSFQAVSNMSLLDKEPTVSASGAIAVFVLVYLFNPIL